MIAPTIVVVGVAAALIGSVTGRTRVLVVGLVAACVAGSWGYCLEAGVSLWLSVPRAVFGSVACVLAITALIVACERSSQP